jgi:CxxC motif-containing protein (DUF1111 family)
MKFLAPIPRGQIDDRVRAGETLFHTIGCANCHLPMLQTDVGTNPLFSRRTIPLYSDLLLHDIGTGDGIRQGAALPNEIRTPALWGLRFRRPLLHDGSATTIREALLRHAGEAGPASRAFQELLPPEQDRLLAFLESL